MKRVVFVWFLGCLGLLGKTASAATTYTVGAHETVYGVAYKHNIPTQALISANNLKPPHTLEKGQQLTIPAPGEHIVGDGESLQSIAEQYGVNVDVMAQENGIQAPYFASPGTHLMIPSRDTESFAEALKPPTQDGSITTSSLDPLPLVKEAPAQRKSPSSLEPLPLVKENTPHDAASKTAAIPQDLANEIAVEKGQGKAIANSSSKLPLMGNLADKTDKQQKPTSIASQEQKEPKKVAKKEDKKEKVKKEGSSHEVTFVWPVEGTVIGKFAGGGKNDGINIKVAEGTPVKAAASGEVLYAGNELKGFGDLVLIKHKSGWITAYAHNSSLKVKKGETVKQGQEIARSGKSGDVKEAQLHFEIRKGKQPVDPLPKLRS